MVGGDDLGLRVDLAEVQVRVAGGVLHLLGLDVVALQRGRVDQELTRVELGQRVVLRQGGVRMDVTGLRVLVHGLRVVGVLLRLPGGVDGVVPGAVLVGGEVGAQQVEVEARNEALAPGILAPAAVGDVGVLLRMELLVRSQVGLQVRDAGDRGGIHADFLSRVEVDDVAVRHSQLLVDRHRVVDAVDLGTGDEQRVQAVGDVLAVGLQQVAVGAVVIVQRGEQALHDGAGILLPVRGEEQVDFLAGLQSGQRAGIPVRPADDAELDVRADQRLDVSVDRLLDRLARVGVLVADLIIEQVDNFAGIGAGGGLGAFRAGIVRSGRRLGGLFRAGAGGHREHHDQRQNQRKNLLGHVLFLLRIRSCKARLGRIPPRVLPLNDGDYTTSHNSLQHLC